MHFEKGHLYHIYNQGNNHQRIFFEQENYLFFLKKLKLYVMPYADILAWCLMPNHFHLMVRVNELKLYINSEAFAGNKLRTLNQSIGVMLRSYTWAINKQESRSGALFRQKTKAECLTCTEQITPSFYNTKEGTQIHVDHPEWEYPQVCFNYIHRNPVVANLVQTETEWKYSSAKDYAGLRDGNLVNKTVSKQYVDIYVLPKASL